MLLRMAHRILSTKEIRCYKRWYKRDSSAKESTGRSGCQHTSEVHFDHGRVVSTYNLMAPTLAV